jgi:hypothetical protein
MTGRHAHRPNRHVVTTTQEALNERELVWGVERQNFTRIGDFHNHGMRPSGSQIRREIGANEAQIQSLRQPLSVAEAPTMSGRYHAGRTISWHATGSAKPFKASEGRGRASSVLAMLLATTRQTRVCPPWACEQRRAARFVTVPMAA